MNVIVDMRVVAGEINAPNGDFNGTDLTRVFEHHPEGAEGTLIIDAEVGFGQLNLDLESR